MLPDKQVPQAKLARGKKATLPEPPKESALAGEDEAMSAREIAAATTEEILGKKPNEKSPETKDEAAAKAESEKSGDEHIKRSPLPLPINEGNRQYQKDDETKLVLVETE